MIIELIYAGCLAHGDYHIQSNTDACIIDQLREVGPHIKHEAKNNAKIEYVLETHFNADFVPIHIHPTKERGAEIFYWPNVKSLSLGQELLRTKKTILTFHLKQHD
ncbi:hypothetical protein [Pedobacter sp.]|uniref:hypothetical protein n=1 Tax=Pedobacter sp. TaxID=1411316 RepID=UPI003C67E5B7